MKRTAIATIGSLMCGFVFGSPAAHAVQDHFFTADLGAARATGPLGRLYDSPTALHGNLGYLYAASRHWWLGAGGGYHSLSADSLPSLSVYTMNITARFRFMKHGWTPYLDAYAGAGFVVNDAEAGAGTTVVTDNGINVIDGTDTRAMLGTAVGVQIPISDRIDMSASVKFLWMPGDHDIDLGMASGTVGIVYVLQ